MRLPVVLIALAHFIGASPLYWRKEPPANDKATPVSVDTWDGKIVIPGAFVLSRLNLKFINNSCTQLAEELRNAAQIAQVLAKTDLVGVTQNQVNRYGATLLNLEKKYLETLDYQKNLLLCSGRGGELWSNFRETKRQFSKVWSLLKQGITQELPEIFLVSMLDNSTNATIEDSDNSEIIKHVINPNIPPAPEFLTGPVEDTSLITLMESARPLLPQRQPRGPALLGIGLSIGLLGSVLFSKFFSSTTDNQIESLNKDIQKQNKLLKLTNERVDILAKNVTDSFNAVKDVLDKLVTHQELQDVHFALLWNFEQLVTAVTNIQNNFRSAELTVTLLDKQILNPELLNLNSLNRTITEGIKSFPDLEFPVEINRYNIPHIVKLLRIQRISHLKFIIIIPLVQKRTYDVYTLIPHPIKIDENSLVIPELKEILLKDEETYIITDRKNIYSLLKKKHILLTVEPIFKDSKMTCELAGFLKNVTSMLELCNYKKAGQSVDVYMYETEQQRLVYFFKQTRVTFDCPDKLIKDTFIGLHKLPLACNIITEDVSWPAKQTITVDSLDSNNLFTSDTTKIPIAQLNTSSNVHESLRKLISKINTNDSYTIDFKEYGYSLEQVTTYSVFAQFFIIPLVIINSFIIALYIIRHIMNKKEDIQLSLSRMSSFNDKFHDKFHDIRDSIRSKRNKTRESLRQKRRNIRRSLRKRIENSPKPIRRMTESFRPPSYANIGTNTENTLTDKASKILDPKILNNVTDIYPALPRYV